MNSAATIPADWIEQRELVLSRLRSGLATRLGSLSFEGLLMEGYPDCCYDRMQTLRFNARDGHLVGGLREKWNRPVSRKRLRLGSRIPKGAKSVGLGSE